MLCRTPRFPVPPQVQVCESKRLGCHAGHQGVSRCRTRGINCMQTPKPASEGSTLALKPRADIKNRGISGLQKRLMHSIFFKKKRYLPLNLKRSVGHFKKIVDTCPFLGSLIPLFQTSVDVFSGFQSQNGQLYFHLAEAYIIIFFCEMHKNDNNVIIGSRVFTM